MLSTRLIHMIESHAEQLTQGLVKQLTTDERTSAFRRLSDSELHNRTYSVYSNLGSWLGGKPGEETRRHYEDLGRTRCAEGIPLHEVIYALILSKKNLFIYMRHQGFGGTAMEIYGEQELVNRVDQFYNDAIYFTALGYESALESGKKSATARSVR